MHEWHLDVAARSAEAHPESRVDPRQLWETWNGPHRFYQDPLYALSSSVVYRLGTGDPRLVLAGELALGVLSNVLIYLLARRYLGQTAGAIAAFMALLCGPLMYYELLLAARFDDRVRGAGDRRADRSRRGAGRLARFLALGLALGFAYLLKSSSLLLAAVLAIGLAIGSGAPHSCRWRPWPRGSRWRPRRWRSGMSRSTSRRSRGRAAVR